MRIGGIRQAGRHRPDGRLVDHPPACRVDLDRPPSVIAEVEIETIVEPADADMDDPFRPVEMRLGFDHVARRLERLRTRRAACRLEEAAFQLRALFRDVQLYAVYETLP